MQSHVFAISAVVGLLFCRAATKEQARRIFARAHGFHVRLADVMQVTADAITAPFLATTVRSIDAAIVERVQARPANGKVADHVNGFYREAMARTIKRVRAANIETVTF